MSCSRWARQLWPTCQHPSTCPGPTPKGRLSPSDHSDRLVPRAGPRLSPAPSSRCSRVDERSPTGNSGKGSCQGRPGRATQTLWRSAARMWEEQLRADRPRIAGGVVAQAQVARGEPPSTIAASAPARARALSGDANRCATPWTRSPDGPTSGSRRGRPRCSEQTLVELPVALTTRELEILRHLAAGRSNAQIAHDLFISPKTVSVHVSNLLRKIGVSNRPASRRVGRAGGRPRRRCGRARVTDTALGSPEPRPCPRMRGHVQRPSIRFSAPGATGGPGRRRP